MIKWFENWLSNRVQYTRYCDSKSSPINIEMGVPQGTPLSCPLFNLYVNDVVHVVTMCKLNLFADDALLWVDAEDVFDAVNKIKIDLMNVIQFMDMCKLKLNLSKTKLMVIGETNCDINELDIPIGKIERVKIMKYLGVIIDDELKLMENLGARCKRNVKNVRFLNRN